MIITDSEGDITILQYFAKIVLGSPIHIVTGLVDFWMMLESATGIFVVSSDLLETDGDIDYLSRHSLHEIKRGSGQTIEDTINKLIDF